MLRKLREKNCFLIKKKCNPINLAKIRINSMFRIQNSWWLKIVIFVSFSSFIIVTFGYLLTCFKSTSYSSCNYLANSS